MKSKMSRMRVNQTKALSRDSWTNYRKLLGRLCQEHDTGWSKDIQSALQREDVRKLVDIADALSSQLYGDATEHFVAHQFANLIKKYPFPSELNPFDPEAEARTKFEASEQSCKNMNEQLPKSFLSVEWATMRNFIRYVIGDAPDMSTILRQCDFGPGASLGVHGNATNSARKLLSDWTVTPSALEYAASAIVQDHHILEYISTQKMGYPCASYDREMVVKYLRSACRVVHHNKIAFVPKTVKTFRSIAVEPTLNSYLQKGADEALRGFLKRIGIDLSNQENNAEFARQGSLCDDGDSFVTIDLSSASDSISRAVVAELLPESWFLFLDAIRAKQYEDSGVIRTYEKFCSMGNGFCFPLETLLFTAACNATGCGVPGRDFLVYGDDIVVRKRHAVPLLELLHQMGFSVNPNKTFITGPFRESCGRDWFEGKDVRPFVLDFALDSVENIFKFANLTLRNGRTEMFFCDVRQEVINLLDPMLRLYRPSSGQADTAIDAPMDLFMTSPHARWSRDHQAWTWLELVHAPIRDSIDVSKVPMVLQREALRGSSSASPFVLRRQTRTRFARKG